MAEQEPKNFTNDGVGMYPDMGDERLNRLGELVKSRRDRLQRIWPSPAVVGSGFEDGIVGPYKEQKIALDTAQSVIDYLAGRTEGVKVKLPMLGDREYRITG